jgi:limonene-1,2-epoxide hydrolase
MTTAIEDAREILIALEAQQKDAAVRRAAVIDKMRPLALPGTTGNSEARTALDRLGAERADIDRQLFDLGIAIDEARAAVGRAGDAERAQLERDECEKTQTRLTKLRERAAECDAAAKVFAECLREFWNEVTALRQGRERPSHAVARSGLLRAWEGYISGLPVSSARIPASLRTTFAQLAEGWSKSLMPPTTAPAAPPDTSATTANTQTEPAL